MADLALSVVVNRDALGLAPLDCNDGLIYKASPQLLGATVAWNRVTATSPYVDGDVTVSRTRQKVQEQIAIEVIGRTNLSATRTAPQLQANMATLVSAFSQDSFVLTVTVDGAVFSYQAEASDYQLAWVGPRWMAREGLVTFTMPRQPVPIAGVV